MKDFLTAIPKAFITLDRVPEALFSARVEDLASLLDGPTIVAMPGLKEPPVFVSTLLHGNEHTGFLTMQRLLNQYRVSRKPWPRTTYWLIGNVEAAAQNHRHLVHQPDFNRIWRGGPTKLAQGAQELAQLFSRSKLFANIDIHNNTGKNPHYACVSQAHQDHFYLASLFGRTAVFFRSPSTTQSVVFSEFAPSVTIECGLNANPRGVRQAVEFVDSVLRLDHFPTSSHVELDLFQTVARIMVPQGASVGFNVNEEVDFLFRADLDDLNFQVLPRGTTLGRSHSNLELDVEPIEGMELLDWLTYQNGNILTNAEVIPSMFSKDERVIRQDCLGYIMQRLKFEKGNIKPPTN